jgi:hypothetical protein
MIRQAQRRVARSVATVFSPAMTLAASVTGHVQRVAFPCSRPLVTRLLQASWSTIHR